MSKKNLLYHVLSFCGLLLFPLPVLAASALSISSPASDGVFVLQGTGLRDVSGMEVAVSYDAATLANPRVQMGGLVQGMVSAVNSTNPLKLAMLSGSRSVSGDGTIATITFDRLGSSPGRITSLKGDLRNLKGQRISSHSFVLDAAAADPPRYADDQQGNADSGDPGTPPVQQDQPYVGGTVTMPEEPPPAPYPEAQPPQQEEQPQVPGWEPGTGTSEPPAPQPEPEPAAEAPPPSAPAPPAPLVQGTPGSVLERFRLHQGEKSPQQLLALFEQPAGGTFTQYPAVALSDGKQTVTLVIRNVPPDVTPRFVFDSARFVSLGKGEGGEWEVEVRPDKGALRASAKLLVNDKWQEFPLTVAPKVELPASTPGGVTEADLEMFLKERGGEAAPKHDLNGDGKRDYLDDYIYCANYLVNQRAKKKQQSVPR